MRSFRGLIHRLTHPEEYPAQRERRAWLAALAKGERVEQARPVRRVDIMCRCGHPRGVHVVPSAASAWCDGDGCLCSIFRGERLVLQ